ncbi:MAG: hypothetical protein ACE5KX_08610, partial [Acidimicrobiia bacterium]
MSVKRPGQGPLGLGLLSLLAGLGVLVANLIVNIWRAASVTGTLWASNQSAIDAAPGGSELLRLSGIDQAIPAWSLPFAFLGMGF